MTCRELVDFLLDYTSGELTPAVKAEFERHLSLCPPCLVYVRSYEATVRACRASRGHVDPADAPEELVQAILASRRADGSRLP